MLSIHGVMQTWEKYRDSHAGIMRLLSVSPKSNKLNCAIEFSSGLY
jgi:hypothetical protein